MKAIEYFNHESKRNNILREISRVELFTSSILLPYATMYNGIAIENQTSNQILK